MITTTPPAALEALSKSRGWLIAGGLLSIFIGFMAVSLPLLFSAVVVQVLAIFALISGITSLAMAIFGKHVTHRVMNIVFALLYIATGVILLACLTSGVAVITLILAVFFIVEGISSIIASLKLRGHAGWVWSLLSGVAALILGIMVYLRWPSDSAWVIGTLYGINSLFFGMSLFMLGLGARKNSAS